MLRVQLLWSLFLISLLQTDILFAQMALENPPKDNGFFARNINNNKASVTLKGRITDPAYTALKINIYQNHNLKSSYNFTFNFAQNITSFNQKIDLLAGKYIYTIEYVLTGSLSYTKVTDGLMVGDAYLIQGQSNAVAANYVDASINYSSAYRDTFIKSFGNSYPYGPYMAPDTVWYRADGENAYSLGSIGQWPLVLAKTLLDTFGIPVCMINGAVGGTMITQHVSTPGNAADLNSIYGRLLYRVQKAGLANNIRGILYFQGESDGSNAILHDSLFKQVYASWNNDYRGFKKLYVVQVRGRGCGYPSIQLREYQRQFGFSLAKCSVVSSNGLNNHDGCHYGFTGGYELLGKQLAALVSRDLYQSKIMNDIDPPNIRNCYYSNASQDEITVNMQKPTDIIYTDNAFQKIFTVEGDNTVTITSGFIKNNKIVLKLNKSSCNITGLTYDSDAGTQPWVKNRLGMGLISCYNVPILRQQIQSYYTGCKKALISLGEDSIAGCKYLWRRPATKQNFTTARIKIRGDSVELFSLIITYGNGVCKNKDTMTVYLSPDPVTIPELGVNKMICANDTLLLKPDFFGFSQFKWTSSLNTTNYQTVYKVSKSEKIVLTASSQRQCVYKDSVIVSVSAMSVSMPDEIVICVDSDTLITIDNIYKTYRWNKQTGSNQYRAGPGLLILEVSNNMGCKASDSLLIRTFKVTPGPDIKEVICRNESKMILKPSPFKSWYFQSVDIGKGLKVFPDYAYPVILTDSNNCEVYDTIKTTGMAFPEFSMGADTGYCESGRIAIRLPVNMAEYFWNGVRLNNNIVEISTPGNHIASVRDYNQCQFSDTIQITTYGLPDLSFVKDTVLCKDSSWRPAFLKGVKYIVNGFAIPDKFSFDNEGSYTIGATDVHSCYSVKTLLIQVKDCYQNNINSILTSHNILYPNPVSRNLTVNMPEGDGKNAKISNAEGRILLSFPLTVGENQLDLSALEAGYYFITFDGFHAIILKI